MSWLVQVKLDLGAYMMLMFQSFSTLLVSASLCRLAPFFMAVNGLFPYHRTENF